MPNPDVVWYYKRLIKQAARDVVQRVQRVNVQALAATWEVVGVDLSYWQGDVDWPKLASMVDFVIIRAQYGNDWYDPRYEEYRDAADAQIADPTKRLKARGEYCYPKPRKAKNWEITAMNFFNKWRLKPGKLPPVFDLEYTGGLDKNELTGWYGHLYDKFMELSRLVLEQIMTYTSAGYLDRAIGLTEWLKKTLLWVAHWTTANVPILPKEWSNPGKTWKLWQWSATGSGRLYGVESTYIDLNRYHGTLEEFCAEFGVPPKPPVPPPGEEDMIARVTYSPYINVRETFSDAPPDLGNLTVGTTFKVKDVKKGISPACSVWLQIKEGPFADKWVCQHNGTLYLCEIVV